MFALLTEMLIWENYGRYSKMHHQNCTIAYNVLIVNKSCQSNDKLRTGVPTEFWEPVFMISLVMNQCESSGSRIRILSHEHCQNPFIFLLYLFSALQQDGRTLRQYGTRGPSQNYGTINHVHGQNKFKWDIEDKSIFNCINLKKTVWLECLHSHSI